VGLVLVFLALTGTQARAQPNPRFEPRYRSEFLHARTNWTAQPTNVVRAWHFARATFDLAEFATNDTQRAQLAVAGIDAARSAIRQDKECAPAHYYLAMNLGQMARTRLLGALKLVAEMEDHFEIAATLDPHFDFGGPDRNLGILYREAPGWPASIGSRSKARKHLKKAVELAPEYPGNQLEMLQAHVTWKETSAATRLIPELEKCLTDAKARFQGENWEWAWDDWTQFLERLRKAVEKSAR
jgi:hypothetical protein